MTLRVRLAGDLAGIDVTVTPFIIGRAPTCDLAIDDPSISQEHAQLEVQPDGRLVLRDLGSTTGTHLGGRPLASGVWLSTPATFQLGATTLVLEGDLQTELATARTNRAVADAGGAEGHG